MKLHLRKEQSAWIPREKIDFDKIRSFCMDRRLILDGHRIDWIVLGSLVESATKFHAEVIEAKDGLKRRMGSPSENTRSRKNSR